MDANSCCVWWCGARPDVNLACCLQALAAHVLADTQTAFEDGRLELSLADESADGSESEEGDDYYGIDSDSEDGL